MGWLFAVGLGLQEQKRIAVLRALPPIALGHALSIGIIDLTLWSFIMASAHGAGLMLIPLFLKSAPQTPALHTGPMALHMHVTCGLDFANFSTPWLLTSSVAIHTLGYLLVTGLVAILVYEKLGVDILRRAWFNVDVFWMLALMIAGLFILFL